MLSELNWRVKTATRGRAQVTGREQTEIETTRKTLRVDKHATHKTLQNISENDQMNNTRKSSRNGTRFANGTFLLGRRHLGMTFDTGSATQALFLQSKYYWQFFKKKCPLFLTPNCFRFRLLIYKFFTD